MNTLPRLRAALLTILLALAICRSAPAQDLGAAGEMPPPGSTEAAAKDNSVYSCLTIFTRVLATRTAGLRGRR